jgi:hypothetical protein
LAWGYAMVARRAGFKLEPSTSLRTSRACPTIFWSEIYERPSLTAMSAQLRGRGYKIGQVDMRQSEWGWMLISQPIAYQTSPQATER